MVSGSVARQLVIASVSLPPLNSSWTQIDKTTVLILFQRIKTPDLSYLNRDLELSMTISQHRIVGCISIRGIHCYSGYERF